ncbi:hypothetical protein TREMEDRAFT_64331 [Tremella mesenterica DSM 1558]|uniref:uncharacterized protein n=1 Tax=Tremella mesenterica (strain ATCC 24925 / CBS 8224 / DSM 1558 / NBRC 9311 / NRRL Y-6157 / RJB 2259-6 / UBC 559-6) TaxID=578456 RepID=UPI0003F49CD2|nr:uncharacterized protein TREMEDRAFT_64331 [Tremella mesenterica DSM 1558]EIW67739.1 hypothetical protein TREMEDRAFT_64331 [Tremella mesenterica DSM 1558]
MGKFNETGQLEQLGMKGNTEKTEKMEEERNKFLIRLSKCYSDCAAVLVIEHRRLDWSTFVGPFGRMSWSRIPDIKARINVGLHFMLNVAITDPFSFPKLKEDFISLIFTTITTDRLSVEHKYLSAVLSMPESGKGLLEDLPPVGMWLIVWCGGNGLVRNIAKLISKPETPKSFLWKCLNLLVSGLVTTEKTFGYDRTFGTCQKCLYATPSAPYTLHNPSTQHASCIKKNIDYSVGPRYRVLRNI